MMRIVRRLLQSTLLGLVSVSAFLPQVGAEAQASIVVPTGFHVNIFTQNVADPTAITFGPDHRLYIADEEGYILVLNKTGVNTITSGFSTILGLAWHSHKLYVSSTGIVSTLTPKDNYTSWTRTDIVTGLPTGEHQNDGIAFHGKWMYLGVGSTCNACKESNPRSATIMRFHDNGTHAQIYAHGLRNPYGLAVRQSDGQLYATDNGRDDRGNKVPDELNRIKGGKSYGWPSCYGDHKGTDCKRTTAPVANLPPHCSADGLVFYNARNFGSYYRDGAFIAEYGDTINSADTGHVVQYVHFGAKRRKVTTFASGFEHPLAVAVSPNHSLLVADMRTGIIWRIWK